MQNCNEKAKPFQPLGRFQCYLVILIIKSPSEKSDTTNQHIQIENKKWLNIKNRHTHNS